MAGSKEPSATLARLVLGTGSSKVAPEGQDVVVPTDDEVFRRSAGALGAYWLWLLLEEDS